MLYYVTLHYIVLHYIVLSPPEWRARGETPRKGRPRDAAAGRGDCVAPTVSQRPISLSLSLSLIYIYI